MAVVVELEDLKYDLAEIDENLIRSDISVVDQGDRFNDRQRIWEAIYPETGWGKARGNNEDSKVGNLPTFSYDAANKVGVDRSTIDRLIRIGKLPDSIKDLVRNTPLGDNQNELLKLVRIKDPKEQHAAALAYISGEASTITVPKKRGPTKTERQQASSSNETQQLYHADSCSAGTVTFFA